MEESLKKLQRFSVVKEVTEVLEAEVQAANFLADGNRRGGCTLCVLTSWISLFSSN